MKIRLLTLLKNIQHMCQNPHCYCLVAKSCLTLLRAHGLQPTRLLCSWDLPGKNTGAGCHFLLQGTFLTQRSYLHLLQWQADSLLLSHQGILWHTQKVHSLIFSCMCTHKRLTIAFQLPVYQQNKGCQHGTAILKVLAIFFKSKTI